MKPDDSVEKYCKYCEKASALSDPDQMLCRFAGVVSAAHVCRRFRYDPLKRQPKRMSLPEEIGQELTETETPPVPAQSNAEAEPDHAPGGV